MNYKHTHTSRTLIARRAENLLVCAVERVRMRADRTSQREARETMTPTPAIEAWPAIDDALLRLAIESGVAVEALSGARACVEFVSGRKEAAEVRARWRAMLTGGDGWSERCAERMREVSREVLEREIDARVRWRATSRETEGDAGEKIEDEDDARTPTFREAEQAILRGEGTKRRRRRAMGDEREAGTTSADEDVRAKKTALRKIEKLERSAQAAAARLATAKGALAELVGMNTTFVIEDRECVIGRSTEDLKVDVDLSLEGRAMKISRQQAFLKLRWNGEFALRNVGHRPIWCNNTPLNTGQRCILRPHTLLEIGGLRLLFVPNPTLIRDVAPVGT